MVGRKGGKVKRNVNAAKRLLQLRVLRFRLLQDGEVRIGVFPEGEEVVVGGFRRLCRQRARMLDRFEDVPMRRWDR